MEGCERNEIQDRIKKQGEVVRGLKQSNADKSEIEAEVSKLLELKAVLGDSGNKTKFVLKAPKN